MSRGVLCVRATLIALVIAGSAAADADDGERRPNARAELFARHCAACHGASADGRGSRAAEFAPPPADLTRLAARFGSPLPRSALAWRVLDPRHTGRLRICGDRSLSAAPAGPGVEAVKRGTVLTTLEYLDDLQETH